MIATWNKYADECAADTVPTDMTFGTHPSRGLVLRNVGSCGRQLSLLAIHRPHARRIATANMPRRQTVWLTGPSQCWIIGVDTLTHVSPAKPL